MEFFKSTFSSTKAEGVNAQSKSLLAEWNQYQGTSDVEAGPASSETLLQTVDAAGTGISTFFRSSYQKVTTGISSINTPSLQGATALFPSQQQLAYFFSFFAAGLVFLALAFFVFLPTIILSPSKFALAFTTGCCSIMAGFAVLRGWQQQLQHMCSAERLPFTSGRLVRNSTVLLFLFDSLNFNVAYLGSVFATLYSALVMKSYLMSLGCSGLQMVALVYYILSYFPGGAAGAQFVLAMFWRAVSSCLSSMARTVLR